MIKKVFEGIKPIHIGIFGCVVLLCLILGYFWGKKGSDDKTVSQKNKKRLNSLDDDEVDYEVVKASDTKEAKHKKKVDGGNRELFIGEYLDNRISFSDLVGLLGVSVRHAKRLIKKYKDAQGDEQKTDS
jgi:hypothetical protein